jgi:hypothetical protein
MATKKQRRRREKDRRHDYEFVYIDDEGNEVEVATPEKPAKEAPARKAAASGTGRGTRQARAPKPPSWRSVGRMGILMFALLFLFTLWASKAPTKRLIGVSATTKVRQVSAAGMARAFPLTAAADGKLSSLVVYVDKSSTASRLTAALYADGAGRPGKLLASQSGKPSGGKWNSLGITAKKPPEIKKDGRYWLAVLGTGGRLVSRDTGQATSALQRPGASTLSAWSGGSRVRATLPSLFAGAKGSISIFQRLFLPVLYTLILVPSIYLMQRMSYRSYQKRMGQLQQQRGKKRP